MLTIFTIAVSSTLLAGICLLIAVMDSVYPEPRSDVAPPEPAPSTEPPAAPARRIIRDVDLPACGSFFS